MVGFGKRDAVITVGYLRERNRAPKPFVWIKSADTILQKYQRAQGNLSSRAGH